MCYSPTIYDLKIGIKTRHALETALVRKLLEPLLNICVVISGTHGSWSTWSDWSTCSPECHQNRRRTCSNPVPKNGGKYCAGPDLHNRNCTEGYCQGKTNFHVRHLIKRPNCYEVGEIFLIFKTVNKSSVNAIYNA